MGASVEDVLNELGWKDGFRIPVANEENKRLEIELEKKTKRKAELLLEVERTEERINAIEKHAANIEVAHDYNQKLITAHAAQLDAEDHLVRVRASNEAAILQEIRNLEKEKSDVKERNVSLEKELARLAEKIEESKKTLQFDRLKLVKLEEALNRKEDKTQCIESYIKLDAEDFKKLELERLKLTAELEAHRRGVIRAADEVNEMEIILDRTAKMYVESLREQLHLINRWKQSVFVLNQRDNSIQQTLREIDTLQEVSNEKLQLLHDSEQFLDNQINSNKELEDEIKKMERNLISTKDERLRVNREFNAYQLENKSQKRMLEDLGKRTRQMRADVKRKKEEIGKKREKANSTKMDILRLQKSLKEIGNQSLNVAGRLKQLEEMIEEEEKRKMMITKESRRLQGLILRITNQMSDLESEKKLLELRKQSELKKSELLVAYEAREGKLMADKRKLIYHLDIDIAQMETRIERTSGAGIDRTELEKKSKIIDDLEKLLSEKLQENKLLHTQIANLEHDMRKVSNSLASDNEELERLRNKKQDLSLLMEGGEKQRKAMILQSEERQVEESILGLRVSQAERLVANIGDKVYNLDKHRLEIEAAMKERKAEIRVHKEALNLQKRLCLNECSELKCAITERKSRIQQLQVRYDIAIAAMGSSNADDGTPITTTYLKIQAAQERYLLQEEGDKLDATIRRTEHEIRSMENTLRVVNACNDKYKISLGPIDEESSEQSERKKLDEEMYKAIDTLRQRREQLEQTKEDLEKMKANYVISGEDLQRAKADKDNKLWNVGNLERQITEQKERISRADKTLKKLFKDIQRKCECTGDEMILLQEKDIATRELQEQNLASLQRITEFTIRHVEVESYVKKLLASKNIILPCAQHLKPSPSPSRCDTNSEISERTRSRASFVSTSRESFGRIHNFEAEFSPNGLNSTRKNVSPAVQSTRSTVRSQQSQKSITRHLSTARK